MYIHVYLTGHIEIDKLAEVSVNDMYKMLSIHFQDLFGEECVVTKLSQSFDSAKDMFRFDLKPEGEQLLDMLYLGYLFSLLQSIVIGKFFKSQSNLT